MRAVAVAAIDTLMAIALVLVPPTPPATPPSVTQEGVYLIRVSWPNGLEEDVDTYLQTPGGEILYFANRNAQLAHLDRDDLGATNDIIDGATVDTNEERTTLRGTVAGEYVVNAHLFAGFQRVSVAVELYKLRGPDTIVTRQVVTLNGQGDEETAFRFTVDGAGEVTATSRLPKQLVGEVYG